MADTARKFPLVKGSAMRVTKVDDCGVPILGPKSQVVTKGFITVSMSTQTDEGNTITATNANGDTCVRDDPRPDFLGFTLEIALCGVDPDVQDLLTSQVDTVFDDAATPLAVGFDVGTDDEVVDTNFALELWSKIPQQNCAGGQLGYGYMLLPFIQGGNLGDFSIQNDAINFTVSNAKTLDGNSWGVGPYNVLRTATGAPSPLLAPLGVNKHFRLIRVTLPPPVEGSAGAQPLGTLATGATSGIPGTYTPTNSYGPSSLAGMTGITASPTTAWTAGQYVPLQDGSKVHWTGTAWAAGAA